MTVFELKKGYFKVFDGKTAYPMYVDGCRSFDNLPEPDYIYQKAVDKGLPEDQIISLLLRFLHRRRFIKGGYLGYQPLCVSLIGPRGSGKSVGLTGIAVIDGLLAGRRVVSNMPIEVTVKYRDVERVYRSEDLDAVLLLDVNEFLENYYDSMICIDEINVYMADSIRATTNQAYFFSIVLQEMRKRKLDFIFTTQNENWLTGRVRFQTDFYIGCRDNSLINGKPKIEDLGRKSLWKIYDMSGLITGEVLHADNRTYAVPPFAEKIFWNVPFWNCYSTEGIQRREKFNLDQRKNNLTEFDQDKILELENKYKVPMDMVLQIIRQGVDRIPKAKIWEILNIADDRGQQTTIGRILKDIGCVNISRTDYQLPSQAELIKNLNNLGFQVEFKENENG